MTDQTPAIRQPAREIRVVESPSAIMDTARFEHLGRVATVMAQAGLMPDSITKYKEGQNDVWHDFETIRARAFLIASQADNWRADPNAVAQATSIVHGKLMFEGKLVHGIIETRLGVRLKYEFGTYDRQKRETIVGQLPPADDQSYGVKVSAQFEDEDEPRTISGSVAMWHTGAKGPWNKPDAWSRQLRYMGAREWARAHSPALLLGVLTDDEVLVYEDVQDRRGRRPKADLQGKLTAPAASTGFNPDHVASETRADAIEGTVTETTETKPNAVEARANALAIARQLGEDAKEAALAGEDEAVDLLLQGAVTEEQAEFIKHGAAEGRAEREKAEADDGADQTESAADGADGVIDPADAIGFIRKTAYEDGLAGEPLQAVLAECETDEERKVAAEEHERGVQAKVAADAAAAEASDAAAQAAENAFDFESVGGAAPKGDAVYLLTSDEPGQDGKLPTYKGGAQFSRVGPKGAKSLKAYDGHAEPSDPALASQSGGTGVEPTAPAQGGLYAEMAAKDSWLAIKPELSRLYGSDDFKALTPEDQAATRAHLFGAVLEVKERTKDPVDWASDPSAFALFADHTAARTDIDPKEAADMIDGTFQTLQGSKLWLEKLPAAAQGVVTGRVQAMLERLRGA